MHPYVEFLFFVAVTQYFPFHSMAYQVKTAAVCAKWTLNVKGIYLQCVSMSMVLEDTTNTFLNSCVNILFSLTES